MRKFTVKTLDGNVYWFDEDKIIGQNPADQMLARLKVIIVNMEAVTWLFNTDNIVSIGCVEKEENE